MFRFICIVSFLQIGSISWIFAQQEPQFSQYMLNTHYTNPAYAGISRSFSELQFIHRVQYLGYTTTADANNPPVTQYFSFTSPLIAYNLGLGAIFTNDQFGPTTTQQILISAAYQIKLSEQHILALGASSGAMGYAIDNNQLRFIDSNDRYATYSGTQTQTKPIYKIGIFYNAPQWYAGIALNHIIPPRFDFGTGATYQTLARHLYYNVGIHLYLTPEFRITPSALIKSDIKTYSSEVGILSTYLEKFIIGFSWRQADAITAIVGIYPLKDNRLHFNYAFDYIYKNRTAKAPTSHEILITYRFGTIKPFQKTIIRTPRFRY